MIVRQIVEGRKRITVLTDPQRRVYNGCPFSSEEAWSAWAMLGLFRIKEEAEASAASWRQINKGWEYRVVEVSVTEEQARAYGWRLP